MNEEQAKRDCTDLRLKNVIEIVRDLKWRGKQKLTVHKSGNKIIIEDWKK